ncbi:MAG: c-type cytochrome biogenesis protein CcsB [Elusimicrobia bacterium]|nr:c-type cytochrome biogenesis protein CcsB [Elusimicrobiota bacterium]
MNLTFLNAGFAIYGAALAVFAAAYLAARPGWRPAGRLALWAAWLLQCAFLALRWKEAGHVPLSNQFESLAAMSWGLTGTSFFFHRKENESWLPPGVAALSVVSLGVCALLDSSMAPLVPALQSNWLLLHVAVIMLGYGALALSFLASVLILAWREGARPGAVAPGAQAVLRLPEGAALALDRFNERAMGLGYLLLTAGIVLGAVWANEAWGSYWSWDPKETWSLITWLVYTAALHLRRTHCWQGRRMAWLSALGFAFVLFTYFGVNYLMSGLHSYA